MKGQNSGFVAWRICALALSIVSFGLSGPAWCQTAGVALLVQQTPARGGTVVPPPGVHGFAPGSQVALTAVPKPGYRFLYWLGDVSDPNSSSTSAYLDSSKIIVAVFEEIPEGYVAGGGSPSADRPEESVGGGGISTRQGLILFPPPEPESPPPQQTAEPSTVFLLGCGAMMLRRRWRPA
jgi:hypothetical protein